MMKNRKIDWPIVALVLGLAAIAACVVLFAPHDLRAPLVGLIVLGTGALRSYLSARATDPSSLEAGDRVTPVGELDEDPTPAMGPRALRRRDTPPGDRSRRDGSVSPRLLATTLAVLLAVIAVASMGWLLSGCGVSAVRFHASASTVASGMLADGRRELLAATDEAIAACEDAPDHDACIDAAEQRIKPLGVAFDAVRLSVVTHRELVDGASSANDSPRVRGTLDRAYAVALAEWPAFLELLRAAGRDVSWFDPEVQ